MASAVYQGYACASSISVSKSKPEVFGISLAPAAVVEGFAVFAFVFALVLSGSIPAESQNRPLNVVATVPELGSLAREIGGDQVEVTVSDSGGLTDVQMLTVSVTGVNEDPEITSSSSASQASIP